MDDFELITNANDCEDNKIKVDGVCVSEFYVRHMIFGIDTELKTNKSLNNQDKAHLRKELKKYEDALNGYLAMKKYVDTYEQHKNRKNRKGWYGGNKKRNTKKRKTSKRKSLKRKKRKR